VDATTICGTDLHILKGDLPAMIDGRTIGHEAVGTVVEVGTGVNNVHVGDHIFPSCITSCGACSYCRQGRYGQCIGGGGWILGNEIDGVQAEYARIPFADTSRCPAPVGLRDEELLMLAGVLPTGYEVGVLNGAVRPGDVVTVIGAGPVGLSTIKDVHLFSPSHTVAMDMGQSRLVAAETFGSDVVVNTTHDDPFPVIEELTGGLGADVAIEAVGLPATFMLATTLVRAVGRVANVAVHRAPTSLHLEELWSKDLTITMGLVDTNTISVVLHMAISRQVDTKPFVTHHFSLENIMEVHDVFSRAGETGAAEGHPHRSIVSEGAMR
jgi:alcohol dehydrogenase